MLDDDALFDALRAATGWRSYDGRTSHPMDYRLSDLRERPGEADVCVTQRDGTSARVVLRLPSSGTPQYWLYMPAEDADDWVGQLLTWIDEEVFTSGLLKGRVREERDGLSYVVVSNYGWQVSDAAEHARLTTAAGPKGWQGGGI